MDTAEIVADEHPLDLGFSCALLTRVRIESERSMARFTLTTPLWRDTIDLDLKVGSSGY